jgi:hypothetical protein
MLLCHRCRLARLYLRRAAALNWTAKNASNIFIDGLGNVDPSGSRALTIAPQFGSRRRWRPTDSAPSSRESSRDGCFWIRPWVPGKDYPSTVLIQNRFWSPHYEQSAKTAGALPGSILTLSSIASLHCMPCPWRRCGTNGGSYRTLQAQSVSCFTTV